MPTSIFLNGSEREVTSLTLEDLLVECGLTGGPMATALNGEFIRKEHRQDTTIKEGDRIEVVSPLEGG